MPALTGKLRPALLATLALAGSDATAGNVLDYIRNYDLNNFALGIAYTASQNPYVGGEDSGFAYPYLTSFQHAAFTDDWLLVNNGDLGFRWVSDSGWVLGGVGRIQTTGTGNVAVEDLLGLEPRHWTVEVGPLVGWRRWPVHLEYKLYKEIFNRHDGLTSEFRLSYPTEWSWGYLVPEVAAIRQDENYTRYYFGVAPSEIAPERLVYIPGAALNYQARLTWGYAINENWLLSGHITSEWLDSEISNSPIIDKDQIWSARIGVAYNADVFQSREFAGDQARPARVEIRAGAFQNNIDTKVIRRPVGGGPGEEIDIEDVLGATERKNVLQLDAIFRIARFHRIELSHFRLGQETNAVLMTDIMFGDETFLEGTEIDLMAEARITRVAYAFSLMSDAQKELGLMAGVHVTDLELDVFAEQTGQRVQSKLSTPLPVIGIHGAIAIGRKSRAEARVQLFRMEFDNYAGSLNFVYFGLQHNFTQNIGVGLGYNYYSMNLDSNDPEINGSLRIQYTGPIVYLSARF